MAYTARAGFASAADLTGRCLRPRPAPENLANILQGKQTRSGPAVTRGTPEGSLAPSLPRCDVRPRAQVARHTPDVMPENGGPRFKGVSASRPERPRILRPAK